MNGMIPVSTPHSMETASDDHSGAPWRFTCRNGGITAKMKLLAQCQKPSQSSLMANTGDRDIKGKPFCPGSRGEKKTREKLFMQLQIFIGTHRRLRCNAELAAEPHDSQLYWVDDLMTG